MVGGTKHRNPVNWSHVSNSRSKIIQSKEILRRAGPLPTRSKNLRIDRTARILWVAVFIRDDRNFHSENARIFDTPLERKIPRIIQNLGHATNRHTKTVGLRQAAGEDLLAFLLLRWTGLRGSDAVRLTWDEIDWQAKEINRLTQKRKKRVVLPIPQELFFALEANRDRRLPQPDERILVNPRTGEPMTRPRLYERMLALGKRAGVPEAHPHRFRDTFAVDLLARGATAYDVAKLLGDTVDTIEKHYAPFVPELRDRARRLMENGEGIEKTHCTFITRSSAKPGVVQ